jgi:hypothetical protein
MMRELMSKPRPIIILMADDDEDDILLTKKALQNWHSWRLFT